MPQLTIDLNEQQFATLQSIAEKKGLGAVEALVRQQLDQIIAGQAGSTSEELQRHLTASIAENRHLLERLAE